MKGQMLAKLKRGSPTILTWLAAGGVIATAVAAVKATPKALRKIQTDSRIRHDGDPHGYTKREAVQSAWVFYIPSVLLGGSTIACIFGANCINKHMQANLASAYALINESYREYKGKPKELYGEEAHKRIIDEIAAEKAERMYLTSPGLEGNLSLDFEEDNPDDTRLFYDTFSKRYFESTINRVLQAEYHLNRNYVLGADITINDFYKFLGVEPIPGGDDLRWYYEDFGVAWIDFNHHKVELDDGLEALVIEFAFDPWEEDDI